MDSIDFAALPDALAARLMAEKDGWRVEMQGEYWSGVIYHARNANTGEQYTSQTKDFVWKQALKNTNYPRSLDAAVGWLGRMGLHWSRYQSDGASVAVSTGIDKRPCIWHTCYESLTCPTARALCNAGWAALVDREESK